MKKITLKKLVLTNFKGQKSLLVDFNDSETQIFGQNRAGKTTIFDAFLWLLFGKDSQDRKDFAVKPLNDKGATTDKTETEVIGTFDFDGNETILRRVLVEKWQKRRGSNEQEFTGNETKFFWNDVPFSAGEYASAIKDRIDESLFKLLTNPARFNELGWQERRQILFSIVGIGSDADIAEGLNDADIKDFVVGILNAEKTLKQYKSELAEKKKLIKTECEQIPPRIDELNRSKPIVEHSEKELEQALVELRTNFNALTEQIESETKRIESANAEHLKARQALQNDVNAREQAIQKLTHELSLKANKAVNDHAIDVANLNSEIRQIEQERASKLRMADDTLKEINRIESILVELRGKIESENSKTFSYEPTELNCPTCKQTLPSEVVDVDALRANFNKEKLERIEQIQSNGLKNKSLQEDKKSELEVLKAAIIEANEILEAKSKELEQLKADAPKPGVVDMGEVNELKASLEIARGKLAILEPIAEDLRFENLKLSRSDIQKRIDELSKEYAKFEQIETIKVRIDELLERERALTNQLSDFEKQEFIIDAFNSAKIKQVEEKINSMFSYVTFKMFNTLINGAIEECCEALINGVPYSDANTGSKINAGLDIISVLSNYYSVSAPCFIDNAESVTGFIPFENQIIKLIVSESDKTLRIA